MEMWYWEWNQVRGGGSLGLLPGKVYLSLLPWSFMSSLYQILGYGTEYESSHTCMNKSGKVKICTLSRQSIARLGNENWFPRFSLLCSDTQASQAYRITRKIQRDSATLLLMAGHVITNVMLVLQACSMQELWDQGVFYTDFKNFLQCAPQGSCEVKHWILQKIEEASNVKYNSIRKPSQAKREARRPAATMGSACCWSPNTNVVFTCLLCLPKWGESSYKLNTATKLHALVRYTLA